MWAMGCILYVFMSGYLPFQSSGGNKTELTEKIVGGKFHFNHEEFQRCSPTVKDLIKKLLNTNPKKRLTAKQALDHEWFKDDTEIAKCPRPELLQALTKFKGRSKLKKMALNLWVKMAEDTTK